MGLILTIRQSARPKIAGIHVLVSGKQKTFSLLRRKTKITWSVLKFQPSSF